MIKLKAARLYIDENAARALKCVRGRKNERGLPPMTFIASLNRQDPLSAGTVWGKTVNDFLLILYPIFVCNLRM